jgi:flagellin-specific chaperone FliS
MLSGFKFVCMQPITKIIGGIRAIHSHEIIPIYLRHTEINRTMNNPYLKYQKQNVMNASPMKIVVKLYDLAIQATWREDEKELREILSTLIRGLNFDYEISGQLFALYQYCQDISRKGHYQEIRDLLEPIRDAWEEAANTNPVTMSEAK